MRPSRLPPPVLKTRSCSSAIRHFVGLTCIVASPLDFGQSSGTAGSPFVPMTQYPVEEPFHDFSERLRVFHLFFLRISKGLHFQRQPAAAPGLRGSDRPR
jgi:hypothetical protein